MRTRSQQASPGGFLSLDDSAPRRTRSARSISQSNTQSSSSAQPPSRTRSQGTGKKAATSRAAKPQTRNGPQRVTRKSTRKTAQQTTDDDDHQSRNNEEPTQTAALDDKENHIELHDRESVTLAENTVLSEPKSSSLSPSASLSAPPNTVDPRWYEYQIDNISDVGLPLSERSRTPTVDGDDIVPLCADLPFGEILVAG
ncbi:hypothetical protein ETB97_012535 [Aspergillus alliaceus]|uniref:Uncharacterized protein n=1 Tax=Petromyces alliaceus TaxID=209559 RepID=A0A8H6EB77_PETAA|nr:hypothetical protein ETB97_012535 [Aspergillus burnettii]